MLIVMASLSLVVVKAVQQILAILGRIQSGDGAINMSVVFHSAHRASTTSEGLIINFGLLFIVFCWIIGAVDACRIRKMVRMDVKR
jgi:hypothetical protein